MLFIGKKILPVVADISPMLGCDPEFFFRFDGKVIGSEKVIPKNGINVTSQSKFIIDGVQAELNPRPNVCRALLGNEIKLCFQTLKKELESKGKGFTVDFSRTVEIPKENLMELNEESRKFGCAPSNSIYKKSSGLKISEVDPTEYRVRAAGGHIHIGFNGNASLKNAIVKNTDKVVEILDLICGNTCVLIDRDEGNIERRKVYGKAGEYRLPPHGLEYRTLSNFWLTSYPLMSMAFGLVRLSVQLMTDTKNSKEYYKEFTSKVTKTKVQKAINDNNFELAMENFMAIEKLLLEVSSTKFNPSRFVFSNSYIKEFHHFINMTKEKGLTYWFPEDPMTHWANHRECHTGCFYDFLSRNVHDDMLKKVKAA